MDCPLSGLERTGAECTRCPRLVAWGLSKAFEPWLICWLPCACCGEGGTVDPAEVVFCDECLERAGAVDEDDELGVGD